jgi:hypothetical protein
MRKIGEIGQRILAELEETWEQNVYTVINTVYGFPSHADLAEYCNAVRSLYEMGLVRITMDKVGWPQSRELPEEAERELLQSLEDWFSVHHDGHWTYSGGDIKTATIPQLLVTEEGHDLAFRLLDERGYQWWKRGS